MTFRPRIVVGIDFGTHGSGFCWCVCEDRNADASTRQINFFNAWPGQPVPFVKNLSALLVDKDQNVLAWGFDARRRALSQATGVDAPRYHAGFKMGLMEQVIADRAHDAPPSGKGESPEGQDNAPDGEDGAALTSEAPVAHVDLPCTSPRRKAESLIVSYLRCLYDTALEQITASGYSAEDIRWCITVPAIWTDEQKQAMRDIAKSAGLPAEEGRLILALEPEAAAHWARISGVNVAGHNSEDHTDLMTPGCRYVVVDCGGGTVDLTAYENDEAGRMVEIGRVNGGPHGANEINKALLEQLLVKRFGKQEILDDLRVNLPEALLDLTEAWERAKITFGPDEQDDILLTIPSAIDRRLGAAVRKRLARQQDKVTDLIVVTPEETRALFDVVVPDILELIDEQLKEVDNTRRPDSPETVVLLVGGFGASPYLQHAVKEHLEGRARVLVPPDPAAAVLFGAAHFGYEPHTRARRSRLTYGAEFNPGFEAGVDREDYRYTNSSGRAHCKSRFSKLVTRGDIVDTDAEVQESYVPVEGAQIFVRLPLYSCTEPDPRYVTDAGCELLGEIEVDLTKVMSFALEDRGITLYMRFGETEIKARAVVMKSGEEAAATLRFHSDY